MTDAAIRRAMAKNPELNATELAQMLANGYNNPEYNKVIHQINAINSNMTDADKLTAKLIAAGADRAKVIAIIEGYGDPVDWSYHSLDSIIAEVWQSDLNSGEEPGYWIINEICRTFNVQEVSE